MKPKFVVALVLLVVAAGACRKKPPRAGPSADSTAIADRERSRADSIAMAERQRMDAERTELQRMERERVARGAVTEDARATLTEVIYFDYDSNDLTPEAQEVLQRKAALLRSNANIRLQIAGHADQRGSTEYNLALGQRRAEAVRSWFAAYGINSDRFATTSFGKERPLVDDADEEAWARNRRAEFTVLGGGR